MILLLIALCVAMEAGFTALEVALGATPRARWRTLAEEAREAERETQDAGEIARARRAGIQAARLTALTEQPERLSLLFICITTLALWIAAALLAGMALRDGWAWWMLGGAFVLVLFVAEVLPLLLAAQNGESVALRLSGFATNMMRWFWPIFWLPGAVGTGLARVLGARAQATTQVTSNELRTALAAAEEEGVIESEERAMLEGAIAFREKPVYTVMTPLEDVIGVREETPLAEVLHVSLEEGHSRLPIFGENNEIRGVLATKDLLRPLRQNSTSFRSSDAMRPPFFLDGETRIAAALEQLRHERTLMAVVTRNGQPLGIVTLEDLLEELVGEIEDEWDDAPALRLESARSTVDIEADLETGRAQPFSVLCDNAQEVTIREVERFWRENEGGLLRLRAANGELAAPDQTLDDFAAHYLAARAGETALVGEARPENEESTDEENAADALKLDALKMEPARVIADVQLEVRAIRNGVICELALRAVARSQRKRGDKKSAHDADKPNADKPNADKPNADKPNADKPNADTTAEAHS